ncbi:helix-turn-helix domain-containing protein [Anaerovorax sp. IOR16]|uniref:helix-turn-helix domain-containing protein n=1 Tax=Anaerovorax sp. IOR16 TaxID=2773458 RepID=UPI0019D102EA|nr:helix-turn-helix transcriptional regulator [Anaerovorax sp. IOR16]
MSDIGKRLEELIDFLQITKKDFARSIEYSPGNVTDWTKGRYKPSTKALSNIEKVYGVSQKWLLEGEGDMMIDTDFSNTDSRINEELGSITDDEIQLIKTYRMLNDKQKGKLEGYLERFIDESMEVKRGMSSTYQNGEEAATREKKHA